MPELLSLELLVAIAEPSTEESFIPYAASNELGVIPLDCRALSGNG